MVNQRVLWYTMLAAIVGGAFLIFSTATQVQAQPSPLDGKTFVGKTGEKGKSADGEDELTFENGKLTSVGCVEWGFPATAYTFNETGDTIQFQSVMVSPEHGKIIWKGTVKGDAIDATYTWTKERWWWADAHTEKWFKGSLRK